MKGEERVQGTQRMRKKDRPDKRKKQQQGKMKPESTAS
jgi:hypothetical protein